MTEFTLTRAVEANRPPSLMKISLADLTVLASTVYVPFLQIDEEEDKMYSMSTCSIKNVNI